MSRKMRLWDWSQFHTASLVHDDVVDESEERRGQASVNHVYGNKVAVLVGDYILSTALLHISYTHDEVIVRYLAEPRPYIVEWRDRTA